MNCNKKSEYLIKQKYFVKILWIIGFLIYPLAWGAVKPITLNDVEYANSSDDHFKIILHFSDPPKVPKAFLMDVPTELIFDFENTLNNLPIDKVNETLSLDLIKGIKFVNSNQKLRLVIALKHLLPYTTEVHGNDLILNIKNLVQDTVQENELKNTTISALNFNRGEKGEGRLILELNCNHHNVDLKENDKSDGFVIQFKDSTIPENLLRNFDVGDFGTPIKKIKIVQKAEDILMLIETMGEYDKITYHIGNRYIIEAKPKTAIERELDKVRKFKFTGEKISLNFQNIEIRAVLQLLADFTNMNIIVGDSVNGNVTLRLDNIPWDQALDFILKSKGLAKRESGNVLLIGPVQELSKYDEMELASNKQLEALAPLKTEMLKINYAKADDIVQLVKGTKQNTMLSDRGTVLVDSRTNTILLKDIENKIQDIKELVTKLDVAVKQVLIEAYIVSATQDFLDSLGIKLNLDASVKLGSRRLGFAGGKAVDSVGEKAASIAKDGGIAALPAGHNPGTLFNFNNDGTVGFGLALSKLPGDISLNLELDLAETETINTIIAKPKVLTLDKQSAVIESGQDIPYQTSSANQGINTTFQKAAIKLQVTPQITPNNQISMDLSINNDTPGTAPQGGGGSGAPINTNSLKTNVIVNNGETIVLGGLMQDNISDMKNKVPFLADLPLIGGLFRNKYIKDSKKQLLFFITPKILNDQPQNK